MIGLIAYNELYMYVERANLHRTYEASAIGSMRTLNTALIAAYVFVRWRPEMGMLTLIVVLILDVLVANYAKQRRKDWTSYFLLSLFLTPLVGFLFAVLSKPEAAVGWTKKCPDCAELIKAEAKVCRFCGRRFEPGEVDEAAAETPALEQRMGDAARAA